MMTTRGRRWAAVQDIVSISGKLSTDTQNGRLPFICRAVGACPIAMRYRFHHRLAFHRAVPIWLGGA
jgi:hypothetical protein